MRGKAAFWTVVIALAIPTVGMTVYAWRMVGNVRADAAVADARLRELAWACLAYADRFGGYPLNEAELRGFAAPEALSAAGDGYPATRAAALAVTELPPPPNLDDVFDTFEVEWPAVRDVQPILRSKGKPTLQGTTTTVGQWLFAMAKRVRKGNG